MLLHGRPSALIHADLHRNIKSRQYTDVVQRNIAEARKSDDLPQHGITRIGLFDNHRSPELHGACAIQQRISTASCKINKTRSAQKQPGHAESVFMHIRR